MGERCEKVTGGRKRCVGTGKGKKTPELNAPTRLQSLETRVRILGEVPQYTQRRKKGKEVEVKAPSIQRPPFLLIRL